MSYLESQWPITYEFGGTWFLGRETYARTGFAYWEGMRSSGQLPSLEHHAPALAGGDHLGTLRGRSLFR